MDKFKNLQMPEREEAILKELIYYINLDLKANKDDKVENIYKCE